MYIFYFVLLVNQFSLDMYYEILNSRYQFPMVQTSVLEVVDLEEDKKAVLLAKTCCYGEAGGQSGDKGVIYNMDDQTVFNIEDTQLDWDKGYVWHIGTFEPNRNLQPGKRVKIQFDINQRIGLMQNHTGHHLLNNVLYHMFEFSKCRNSSITSDGFKFELNALNAKIDGEVLSKIGL